MKHTQVQIITGLTMTVLLIFVLAAAAVQEEKRLEKASKRQQAIAIETGADLYEANCRTCHGSRGEGVGQLGPALGDKFFFTTRLSEVGWQDTLEAYIIAASSHGRIMATRPKYVGNGLTVVMPPWLDQYGGPLRPDQIKNIAAFVLNWQPTALGMVTLNELVVPKTNLADPGIIEMGKTVFINHCGQCHRVAGITTPTKKGPDLTNISATAGTRIPSMTAQDYITSSILIPNAHMTKGYDLKELDYYCGPVLSVKELDKVVAYLLTLK